MQHLGDPAVFPPADGVRIACQKNTGKIQTLSDSCKGRIPYTHAGMLLVQCRIVSPDVRENLQMLDKRSMDPC